MAYKLADRWKIRGQEKWEPRAARVEKISVRWELPAVPADEAYGRRYSPVLSHSAMELLTIG